MQPFRSSPLFPTKKAFRKREMAPRPQRAGFGQWMDAGPPKSMASMGKAVMSPRMHFRVLPCFPLLSLPLVGRCPALFFSSFSLLLSPSGFFEAILFFQSLELKPQQRPVTTRTPWQHCGFYASVLAYKAERAWEGEHGWKRGGGQRVPRGAAWATKGQHTQGESVQGLWQRNLQSFASKT